MIGKGAPDLPAGDAAARLARGKDPVWLSSPGRAADVGVAFEVVASDPVEVVTGEDVGAVEEAWARARARWRTDAPFLPVGFGFLSYDLGERWMGLARGASDGPGLSFRFYDAIWRRDQAGATILAVDEAAATRLLERLCDPKTAPHADEPPLRLAPWRSLVERPDYERHVAALLGHIAAGDIYQANYARPLETHLLSGSSLGLARALRSTAEAPHALWLSEREEGKPERGALVGNSPERFLFFDGRGGVETRPIKGTRRRSDDPVADESIAAGLRRAEKDLAEHLMIVDLERNDLGRVCKPGTVAVEGMARLMSLPTVHHLVSTVCGQLRARTTFGEVLRALFPGGSITGAPKHRAMTLIRAAEPACRGPYTGATGWLGAAGDVDLAVAIRTAVVQAAKVTLWVGGGVVADSRPADEWDETEAKAAAFVRVGGSARADGA